MRYSIRHGQREVARSRSSAAAHRASRSAKHFGASVQNYARPIRIDKAALRLLAKRLAKRIRQEAKSFKGPLDYRMMFVEPAHIRTVRGDDEEIRVFVTSDLPSGLPSVAYSSDDPKYEVHLKEAQGHPTIRGGSMSVGHVHGLALVEGFRVLTVKVNGARTKTMLKLKDLEDDLFSLLIHEASHGAEAAFLPKKQQPSWRSDPVGYYNDPTEVRAYGQQIVDEVLKMTPVTAPISDRVIQMQLSRSRTWRLINHPHIRTDLPYLTPANQALIFKMVWRSLTDRAESSTVNRSDAHI